MAHHPHATRVLISSTEYNFHSGKSSGRTSAEIQRWEKFPLHYEIAKKTTATLKSLHIVINYVQILEEWLSPDEPTLSVRIMLPCAGAYRIDSEELNNIQSGLDPTLQMLRCTIHPLQDAECDHNCLWLRVMPMKEAHHG